VSENELVIVRKKDLREALDMVEDALELLEEQDPHTTSEDLKVLLEHASNILREALRKGARQK
jgi:hypothetical protein